MGQSQSNFVHFPGIQQRPSLERSPATACDRPLMDRPALFSGLLPSEYKAILAVARSKEFARGEMLYIEGDPIKQVFLVTSGVVKMTKLGPSGTEVILRLGRPTDVLGAEGQFGLRTHGTTAQAFRPCRVMVWEALAFRALAAPFPVLEHNMTEILRDHLLELEERFREVATVKVGPRVARQVIRLLEQIGRPAEGGIEIGLSREDLAQMTGTTLFTVSRLFSAWEARGFVRPRREAVAICDLKSLRAISEES